MVPLPVHVSVSQSFALAWSDLMEYWRVPEFAGNRGSLAFGLMIALSSDCGRRSVQIRIQTTASRNFRHA